MNKLKTYLDNKKIQEDVEDLDVALAMFMVPRLKAYIARIPNEKLVTVPKGLTAEIWSDYLNQMLWSFEYLLTKTSYSGTGSIEEKNKFSKGMHLFADYVNSLYF